MDIRTSFVLLVTFCLCNHWAAGQPTRRSPRVKRCAKSPCPFPWYREYSGNNVPKQMKPNDCNDPFVENGMMSQLPIAFDDSKMRTKSEPNFLKFGGHPGTQQPQCNEYPTCYEFGQLLNNGHSIFFFPNIQRTNDPVQMILPTADFSLEHIHFHWGASDDRGSEHVVNGKAYPLEMHMVFKTWNSTRQIYRFAVFAVLFEVAEQNYVTLFDDELEEMIKEDNNGRIGHSISTGINLNFIKPLENQKFYHYENGYHPYLRARWPNACNEPVEYLVAKNPLFVSGNTLAKLRQLKNGFGALLGDNFRPSSPPNPNNTDVHIHV